MKQEYNTAFAQLTQPFQHTACSLPAGSAQTGELASDTHTCRVGRREGGKERGRGRGGRKERGQIQPGKNSAIKAEQATAQPGFRGDLDPWTDFHRNAESSTCFPLGRGKKTPSHSKIPNTTLPPNPLPRHSL